MSGCWQAPLDDTAFVHLRGIRILDMSSCSQRSITSGVFARLRGVSTLTLIGCEQFTSADLAMLLRTAMHPLQLRLAPERIVRLLSEVPADLPVALYACRSLRAKVVNEATRSSVVAVGDAPAAVVGAMSSHPSSAEVAELACEILRLLALHPATEGRILAAGVVEALVAARRASTTKSLPRTCAPRCEKSHSSRPAGRELLQPAAQQLLSLRGRRIPTASVWRSLRASRS